MPMEAPHATNHRAELRDVLERGAAAEQGWFGFEQEYTFFTEETPLGWPKMGILRLRDLSTAESVLRWHSGVRSLSGTPMRAFRLGCFSLVPMPK